MSRAIGQNPRIAARPRHLHGHRPGVRIADLEGLRLLARLDDLVARRQDRDTRPAIDRDALAADHRQQRDFGEAQPPAWGKNDAAVPGFDPLRVEVLAGLEGPRDLDAIARALRVLDHHHRVGAFRQRRARHDFHRLSGAHGARINLSRAHFPDHPQFAWHVGRANREPVASRAGKGG